MTKVLLFIFAFLALSRAQFSNDTISSSDADVNALNYYLYLKNFEVAFYDAAIAKFNGSAYAQAGYYSSTAEVITTMRDQAAAQRDQLANSVDSRDGTVFPDCTYSISFTSVKDFLDNAVTVEDTMTSAGVGVITSVSDSDLRRLVVAISTVDARHSTYLRTILGSAPFPVTVTSSLSPSEVISSVSGYVDSCEAGLTMPSAVTCSNSGTSEDSSNPDGTSSTDNSQCDNLIPLCLSQCGQDIGVCRCTDGIPVIQCGSATGLAVSFMLMGSLVTLALF